MTTKSSANDSQIAVLMKDFDDADLLLGKVDMHPTRVPHLTDRLDRGIHSSLARCLDFDRDVPKSHD